VQGGEKRRKEALRATAGNDERLRQRQRRRKADSGRNEALRATAFNKGVRQQRYMRAARTLRVQAGARFAR
jgi:hypothetical protein